MEWRDDGTRILRKWLQSPLTKVRRTPNVFSHGTTTVEENISSRGLKIERGRKSASVSQEIYLDLELQTRNDTHLDRIDIGDYISLSIVKIIPVLIC